jgi:hypothetical protein
MFHSVWIYSNSRPMAHVCVKIMQVFVYVPSFVKNPLKNVDSSVHKDVMR